MPARSDLRRGPSSPTGGRDVHGASVDRLSTSRRRPAFIAISTAQGLHARRGVAACRNGLGRTGLPEPKRTARNQAWIAAIKQVGQGKAEKDLTLVEWESVVTAAIPNPIPF